MEKNKTIRFSYDKDTMGNHKAFIWVGGPVLVVSYLICTYFWGYNIPVIPYTFLFVYLMYLWSRRWEGKNEETEKEMALGLIGNYLKEDVRKNYGDDVIVDSVGYFFYRNENNEKQRCVLAYLSNNKTILYNVICVPNNEDNVCSCEIDLKAMEVEDRKLVRKIIPHFRPLLYLTPANDMKVRIFLIYFIGVTVLIALLLSTVYFKWIPLACLLGYMIVMGLLAYLCHLAKWGKVARFFAKGLSRMIIVLYYTIPAGSFVIVMLLSLCIAFGIPCGILYFIEQYTDVELEKAVRIFVCLVMSTIILVHFHQLIRNYILMLLFKQDIEYGIQKHPFVEVALNLIQGRNVNFLIYLLYFLFLAWTTTAKLQGFDPWFDKELIDGATPAFLVHIAYTNMIIRLKDVDLKMDTMIKFMMRTYKIRVLQFKHDISGEERC